MKWKNWLIGGAIVASSLLNQNDATAQNKFGSVDEITSHYDSLRNATIEQYESLPESMQSVLEDSHNNKMKIYDVMEKDVVRMHNLNESLESTVNNMNDVQESIFNNAVYDSLFNNMLEMNEGINQYRFESMFPNLYEGNLFKGTDSTRTDTKELSRSILYGND